MKRRTIIAIMAVGTIIFLAIIGFSVSSSAGDDTKELQLLHVIIRHGIRTPADTYPNDPYINETFYPTGWGQVTNPGKLLVYQTGKLLRERYGKFLGDRYDPEEYYTQSTDSDRVKVTLQLVNAGLWPPKGDQEWGPLAWQPIPIHYELLDQDNLLLVRRPCPQYHIEKANVLASDEIQAKLKANEQLFEDVAKFTGKKIKDFEDIQDVYSTLLAEETFNLTLPEWTKGYYPDRMLEPTEFSYVLNAYNDKLNRLKGGVLVKKLIGDWKAKSEGSIKPATRKAFLYGAHDSTIANTLSALKVWDPQVPGYGVMILLELSRDRITNEFGVEVFLRNSTQVPPHQLTIPGCDAFCPLTKLVELTANVIPDDWDKECTSDDPNYTVPPLGGP